MENSLENMGIIHFADDSTLHIEMRRNLPISTIVNNELNSINNWLKANRLVLNVDKTKYMIFSIKDKPPDLNISIANTPIGRTNEHKFLGVHDDDGLTFGVHISKLCAKISRGIGVLRRMKQLVSHNVLKQLYFAFVHSHLSYAITSYQAAYLNQTQKLKNLINKAIKLVFNLNTLTTATLKDKNVMNFDMTAEYFSCINMYRIMKTDSHKFFSHRISTFQTEHRYETRATSHQLVNLPFYRLNKCQRSFLYTGLSFWNKLPVIIRNIPNDLRKFKKSLRNYIFDRI